MRVDNPRVSGEHAALHWTGERWELRDLGSRNGTFTGDKLLAPGVRLALSAGDAFSLGGPGRGFVLEDASAPAARARTVSGRVREALPGPLVLPGEDDPQVSIFEDASGAWVAEMPEATRTVQDGDAIEAGGETWILELPAPFGATWHAGTAGPTLETIALRLAVSRNEEHVEVTVRHEEKEMRLPSRNHQYLLVVLARARLADRQSGPGERGFVEREELCRMLAVDTNKLGVDIFRTRKQFGELGIHGAADIIVRRPATGQLRIGTERVEVVEL